MAFHEGHDVLQQLVGELVLRAGAACFASGRGCRSRHAAVGHHHKHGPGLLVRQQIVHDEAGAAHGAPAGIVVAASMEQVQHRVAGIAVVIARRRIDVHAARHVQSGGLVPDDAHLAVRHRPRVFEGRFRTGNFEHVVVARNAGLDLRVLGVHRPDAVNRKRIAVEIRCQRFGGERPDAFVVLFHGGPSG